MYRKNQNLLKILPKILPKRTGMCQKCQISLVIFENFYICQKFWYIFNIFDHLPVYKMAKTVKNDQHEQQNGLNSTKNAKNYIN